MAARRGPGAGGDREPCPDGGGELPTIDWERVDAERGVELDWALTLEVVALAALATALAAESGLVPAAPTVFGWDVAPIDWLFALVLVLGAFHVALPMARAPRLSRHYWRRFRRDRVAVVALGYLAVVFALGLLGPLLWRNPNDLVEFARAHRPPVFLGGTWAHPLGTDAQGRPLSHLVVYGMRVSMEVGLASAALAITIGTAVGATAAHFGGLVDEVLMRYVDLQQTFPVFVLLLFLIYLYGPSLLLIVVLYGVFGWEGTGRLVRSEALQRTEEGYVRAAEASGASRWWIVRRHLVPNVSSTVITAATLSIPVFILGEAALAFLGFSDPDVFSWGATIAAGRGDLATAPWVSTVPGVVLFLTVLAFNFVGDAVRDAVDPR